VIKEAQVAQRRVCPVNSIAKPIFVMEKNIGHEYCSDASNEAQEADMICLEHVSQENDLDKELAGLKQKYKELAGHDYVPEAPPSASTTADNTDTFAAYFALVAATPPSTSAPAPIAPPIARIPIARTPITAKEDWTAGVTLDMDVLDWLELWGFSNCLADECVELDVDFASDLLELGTPEIQRLYAAFLTHELGTDSSSHVSDKASPASLKLALAGLRTLSEG
jgi:hypothetical protein